VLYTEFDLFGSTLVDFIWLLMFEVRSFEQREIPFFLFIDMDVVYLLGRVFLFDKILDYLSTVYFLLEFAVLRLLEVE
jgi:hypothetical protein